MDEQQSRRDCDQSLAHLLPRLVLLRTTCVDKKPQFRYPARTTMNTKEILSGGGRQSLTDKAYHHIKGLILSGQIRGGEKVPEEMIADIFKVSRTPIREALRKLEQYGLIYIKPRSYAVVVKLEPEEIYNISLVRINLEKLAFRLFCESAAEADIKYLKKIAAAYSRFLRRGSQAEAFEADGCFHLEVAKRTRNKQLYEILDRLDAKVQLMRLYLNLSQKQLESATEQHEKLIEYLLTKDLSAINKTLERHIMDRVKKFHPA
jgi:DNA-binding GntR family transcriptional regulator